jgi:methionyl-tRNA formyltransferase
MGIVRRVAFAGTPEFAARALAALGDAGFEIPLVLTQPDRPAGRGLKPQASPVKAWAQAHGVPVAQPQGLRLDGRYAADAAAARQALHDAAPQVLVVAAYGLLLPAWTLALPPGGCLNIHASRLPRWRGAAPIQRAIEAGDTLTGVALMQMDEGLDTGGIVAARDVPIAPDDTAARLHDRLAEVGADLLVRTLRAADTLPLVAAAQPADGVTYAQKILKAEAAIDWTRDAAEIERRLRAFDPFPGAHFTLDGAPVKAWRGRLDDTDRPADAEPGTVLGWAADGPRVACGRGVLVLTELQRPGGRRLPARQALPPAHWPDAARLSVGRG